MKAELEANAGAGAAMETELMDAVFDKRDSLVKNRFPDTLFERLCDPRANISLINEDAPAASSARRQRDESSDPTSVPSSHGATNSEERGPQTDDRPAEPGVRRSLRIRERDISRSLALRQNRSQTPWQRKRTSGSPASALDEILDYLREHRLYDARQQRWRKWPRTIKTGVERAVLNRFNEIVDAVRQFIKGTTEEDADNDWVFCPRYVHKSMHSEEAASKSHIVVVRRKHAKDKSAITWQTIRSFGEINDRISPEDEEEIVLRQARKACYTFGKQLARRFVLAFDLAGTKMQLWKLDRSGILVSTDFDVHKSPKDFLRVILGMTLGEGHYLGLDPSFTFEQGRDYIELDGMKNPRSGEKYLLKDQWVDTLQQNMEFDMLRWMGKRKVKRVVRLEAFQLISFKISEVKTELDSTKNDRTAMKYPVETPEHYKLLVMPYGEEFVNFRSLKEHVSVFKDYVGAIGDLYEAGVSCRDISPGNLIIATEHDGSRNGYTIDFDCAIFLGESSWTGKASLLGTLPFMAADILVHRAKGFGHKYYHDLESLFYCFLWICFTEAGPRTQGHRPKFDVRLESTLLKQWCPVQGDRRAEMLAGCWKYKRMHDTALFKSQFLEHRGFGEYFKRLCRLMESWRQILFQYECPDSALPEEQRSISERNDVAAVFTSITDVFETTLKELPDKDDLLDMEDTKPADHLTTETHAAPEIEAHEQGFSATTQGGQVTGAPIRHDGQVDPDTNGQKDNERSKEKSEAEVDKAADIRLVNVRDTEPVESKAGLTHQRAIVEIDLNKATTTNPRMKSRGTKRKNESEDEEHIDHGCTSPRQRSKRPRCSSWDKNS